MLKKNFHITENGPKKCTAGIRNCPVGGAHFEFKDEAQLAYELTSEQKYSPFQSLRKKSSPFTSHIDRANKLIAKEEADLAMRDERQKGGTLYHQLLKEGFTEEELVARAQEELRNRESGITFIHSDEGEAPIAGLLYTGDYKAEEEWGLHHISKSLKNGEYPPENVVQLEKDGYSYLILRGERSYEWDGKNPEQSASIQRAMKEARNSYDNWKAGTDWRFEDKLNKLNAAEMKEQALKLGVKAKTKDEARKAILADHYGNPRTTAQGYFQSGDALAIVTKDPLEAKMFAKLKEANDGGNLRVGSSSNPFSNGVGFYDQRDLSRAARERVIRTAEAKRSAEAFVAETRTKMRERGSVFAVSPEANHETQDIREATYWLNHAPNGRKQIFGRFTKEQLDRIADGDYSDVKD